MHSHYTKYFGDSREHAIDGLQRGKIYKTVILVKMDLSLFQMEAVALLGCRTRLRQRISLFEQAA